MNSQFKEAFSQPEKFEDYSGFFDEIIQAVKSAGRFHDTSGFPEELVKRFEIEGVEAYFNYYREQMTGLIDWVGGNFYNHGNRFISNSLTMVNRNTCNNYFDMLLDNFPEILVEGISQEVRTNKFINIMIAIDNYVASKYLCSVAVYVGSEKLLTNQSMEFLNDDNTLSGVLQLAPMDMFGMLLWANIQNLRTVVSKEQLLTNVKLTLLHNHLMMLATNFFPRDSGEYFHGEKDRIIEELDLSENEKLQFHAHESRFEFSSQPFH